MRLLVRIVFGPDVSIGILWYVSLSVCFGEGFNPWVLGLSVFCVISPDTDLLPWKILRKRFSIQSHQDVFHHPIIFIPAIAGIGIIFAHFTGNSRMFASMIAIGATMLHFVHDSYNQTGMHWLSPFDWSRYKITGWRIWRMKKIRNSFVNDFYEKLMEVEKGTNSFVEAITKRSSKTESLSVGKLTLWIFSVDIACWGFYFL